MDESAQREDLVRARAYALWMESGRPESAAMEFWLEAERQIEAESRSDGAAAVGTGGAASSEGDAGRPGNGS